MDASQSVEKSWYVLQIVTVSGHFIILLASWQEWFLLGNFWRLCNSWHVNLRQSHKCCQRDEQCGVEHHPAVITLCFHYDSISSNYSSHYDLLRSNYNPLRSTQMIPIFQLQVTGSHHYLAVSFSIHDWEACSEFFFDLLPFANSLLKYIQFCDPVQIPC